VSYLNSGLVDFWEKKKLLRRDYFGSQIAIATMLR
jgi:hypothetical protein